MDGLLERVFREPRGVMKTALAFADAFAERGLVVAVDLPSAMAVRADVTVDCAAKKV